MASFNLDRFEFHVSLLRDFPAVRIPTLIDRAIRRTQIEGMGLDRARAHLTAGLEMDHQDLCLMRALMQKSRMEGVISRTEKRYEPAGREVLECAV